jgi:hypothetical protein
MQRTSECQRRCVTRQTNGADEQGAPGRPGRGQARWGVMMRSPKESSYSNDFFKQPRVKRLGSAFKARQGSLGNSPPYEQVVQRGNVD